MDAVTQQDLIRWSEALAGVARTGLGFTESRGKFIGGYWADAAMTVLRVDTNALPPLTC